MMQKTIKITSSVRCEIVVDRPVEVVWPCIFAFPKWAPTIAKAELLSGEWDKQGCVMLLTKKDGVGLQPFYSELIYADPLRRQVYHNMTKDGDQLNGFVDLTFTDEGSMTKVVYSNYLTLRFSEAAQTYAGPIASAITRQDFQDEKAAQSIRDGYLQSLKSYAEATHNK